MASKNIEQGKTCAILSYLLIGIIWYFADDKMRKNAFAKYHVKQGLVLIITWLIIWIVSIPLFFLFWLFWIIEIVLLVLAILGIINAVNGKEAPLPIIGQFAKSFTF